MEKAYNEIVFKNNQSPDLDEDNLNRISHGLSTVDDRVIQLKGDLTEVTEITRNKYNGINHANLGIQVGNPIIYTSTVWTLWCECKPNTLYTLSRSADLPHTRFRTGWTEVEPANNVNIYDVKDASGSYISKYTTGATAKYICVFYATATEPEADIRALFQIEEGNTATEHIQHLSANDIVLRERFESASVITKKEIEKIETNTNKVLYVGDKVQIATASDLIAGYLTKTGGVAPSAEGGFHTPFYKIENYPTVYLSASKRFSTILMCIYDKNQSFIACVDDSSTTELITVANERFDVSELINTYPNAVYFRCGTYPNANNFDLYTRNSMRIDAYVNGEFSKNDKLYGKKLVTAGDSYTEGTWSTNVFYDKATGSRKTWGWHIANRHNMKFINSGVSGSTMGATDATRNPFCIDRYLNVPTDTDYLTIWFGINDEAKTTLGTIDDETDSTFYGAWNKVLRYYLTNMPFCKILLIANSNTSNSNFREAIKNIGKKWGYPVLDWCGDYTIPTLFNRNSNIGLSNEAETLRKSAFGWSEYSAHPSPQAHEWMSTIIEDYLMKL